MKPCCCFGATNTGSTLARTFDLVWFFSRLTSSAGSPLRRRSGADQCHLPPVGVVAIHRLLPTLRQRVLVIHIGRPDRRTVPPVRCGCPRRVGVSCRSTTAMPTKRRRLKPCFPNTSISTYTSFVIAAASNPSIFSQLGVSTFNRWPVSIYIRR